MNKERSDTCMNKNFLITGGAGYIGTALTKRLVQEGAHVTILDNLSTGQKEKIDPRATFFWGDVNRITDLEYVCSNEKFDTVIHLAALKSVEQSEKLPSNYINVNVLGTLNVLEIMKKNEIKKLIFSSTAAVYKENVSGIYTEDDAISPISIYGSSKLICEELINQYRRLGHLSHAIIFRYFNLAGDSGLKYIDENAQNIFPILAKSYTSKREFQIYGNDYPTPDGTGIRDYIHISDLIDAHILSIKHNASGVFNLGTKNGTSVLQIIEKFNQHVNEPLKIKTVKRRLGDVSISIANPEKAKQAFNWDAKKNINDMIQSLIETYNVT